MSRVNRMKRRGFSLVELIIVVVIIGIIGAIAIPKLSRGASGAADNALRGNLSVLRHAIEHYAAEHDGTFPAAATVVAQLTLYSSDAGATSATKDATHVYGPYLKTVPALPVGAKKGSNGIAAADAAGIGWLYTAASGDIKANCIATEVDARGVRYDSY